MIDSDDVQISKHDQEVGLVLLNALVRAVGEGRDEIVTSKDLHRVLAFMSAAVLETDTSLQVPGHYRKAGAYFGEMVATLTKILRDAHDQTGVSMMDLAATSDRSTLN
jgi:hypothetical protein